MNAKKKLYIALGTLGLVVIGAVVAIVSVLSAKTVTLTANSISVSYNAKKVVGDIIADRQIFSLNDDEEISGEFVFDSDDSTFKNLATAALSGEETGASANQNKNLDSNDAISLSDTTFTLVRYTFANAAVDGGGYSSYSASLEYDITTFSNMLIKFYLSDSPTFNTENGSLTLMGTIDGTNYSDGIALSDLTSSGFTIPVGSGAVTSKYVYMVVRVDNLDFDADFSVNFTWNLTAITTAKRYIDPVTYLSFEPISGKTECSVGLKEETQQVAFVTLPENTEIVVPSIATVDGIDYPVTTVRANGFKDCANMASITLPNTITTIDVSAFAGCTGLSTITIPEAVTTIQGSAFAGCISLESITIPNTVTSIGESVFRACHSLTSITIPDSVTSIGNWAFSSCSSLNSIIIPNSVTSIGLKAFYGCENLSTVTFLKGIRWEVSKNFDSINSNSEILLADDTTATDLTSNYVGYFWRKAS